MTNEEIIDMILLGKDHTVPMFRKCGIIAYDEELEKFFKEGYFKEEECYNLTEKGEEFIKKFISDYKEKVENEIVKRIGEKQSIENLTKEMKLDCYFHGSDFITYILKILEYDLTDFRIEINDNEFILNETPVYVN